MRAGLAVLRRWPRPVAVILGLVCVAVGVVLVLRPFASLSVLAALVAAALLVTGVMELAAGPGWLAAGIVVVAWPGITIMPGFARCWMRNPVVRSITRVGLAHNRQTARRRQVIQKETAEARENNGQRAMAGAMRSPARRVGNQRTHAHYRMEAHEALPALARVRRSGTRNSGQPGPLARSHHPTSRHRE